MRRALQQSRLARPVAGNLFPILGIAAALLAAPGLALAQSAQPVPVPATAAPAGQRAPETPEQLQRRLASVGVLIESSSVARQIEASGAANALELRSKARALHAQALDAHRSADAGRAAQLLDQAASTLFAAVRVAAPEQVLQAKRQRDFDTRMESVNTLLAALQRIWAEKKQGHDPELESLRKQAAALAAAGQLEQGKALLDQAYQRIRSSIESLRHGDTLVRSLQFASKEEEYRYEIDRNDNHAMLVKLLLEEKRRGNPGLEGMVGQFLERAAATRRDAEAKAAARDFDTAVKLLEEATRELLRAIRSAGVYIPG